MFHDRRMLVLLVGLPFFFVSLALTGLWAVARVPEASLLQDPPPLAGIARLAGLSARDRFQGALAMQFLTLFMLVPLLIPVSTATYSVVGEKRDRSLEPLLATPLRTMELLLAKGVAAFLPATLTTVGAYTVYAFVAGWLVQSGRVYALVFGVVPLLVILLVGPLLSLLAVGLALIVSSRSTDPRSAELVGSVVVVPLLGVLVAQLFGLFQLSVPGLLLTSAFLACLSVALLFVAARLFSRASILSRLS